MCSPTFQLTPKDANDVVTIFWIAFAFGRLSGIFLTPFFRSWSYVAVDIVGSVIAVVVLICLEYLLENKGAENYKERQIALIVPTIIFAVMVSVSEDTFFQLRISIINSAFTDVRQTSRMSILT